jgi:hypothetical protein
LKKNKKQNEEEEILPAPSSIMSRNFLIIIYQPTSHIAPQMLCLKKRKANLIL